MTTKVMSLAHYYEKSGALCAASEYYLKKERKDANLLCMM